MGYTSIDDNKHSSFRLAFLIFYVMWIIQLILFSLLFLVEVLLYYRQLITEINYNGITLLYGALFGEGVLGLMTKAWNKKQEK